MVKKYYRYSEVMNKLRHLGEDADIKKPFDEAIKDLETILKENLPDGVTVYVDPKVDRGDILVIEYGGYVFECKPKL